jgi:hypothetical protein
MESLVALTGKRKRQPGDPLVDPPGPPIPLWMKCVGAIWIANFVVFVLVAQYLGGSALNGYARDGHYFLGQHSQGPFVEVSRDVFLYSKWHSIALFVSMIAVVLIHFAQKRRFGR